MKRPVLAAVSCMTLLLSSACQDNLPKASQITHMRVLGAMTQVQGDENRSSPKPGETAKLTWNVVFPDVAQDDSQLASLFVVCTPPSQYTGIPVCQELIDIAQGGSVTQIVRDLSGDNRPDCAANPNRVYNIGAFTIVCVTGKPVLDVVVGKDVKSSGKLVRGVICRNGTPKFDSLDLTGTSCEVADTDTADTDTVENIPVYGTVPIQYRESDRNDNPNLDAASLFFHDPPLPWNATADDVAASLSDDTCLGESEAMRVTHTEGAEEQITFSYDAAAREIVAGEPEPLEFSGYCTFGELSRRFTVFASDAELPLKTTFTWTLSEGQRTELNGSSKHVRFYFTALDHRGGFALTTRDLCIDR